MPSFTFCKGREQSSDDEISFLFLNLSLFPRKARDRLHLTKQAVWNIRDRLIESTRIHFLSTDVSVLRACLHGVGDPGLLGLVSFVFTLWGTQNKRNLPN